MANNNLGSAPIGWARDELLERLRLRDRLLLAYLALAGIAAAWGVVNHEQEALLVFPWAAMAIEVMVAQHYRHIGLLAKFCAIHPSAIPLLKADETHAEPVLFDQWIAQGPSAIQETRSRAWGTALVILLPPLAALLWNWKHSPLGCELDAAMFIWWLTGVALLLLTAIHIRRAYEYRRRCFEETGAILVDKKVQSTKGFGPCYEKIPVSGKTASSSE